MKEKIGLKIIDLIHDITQLGYRVVISPDFNGMVRIHFEIEAPWLEPAYGHDHLGFPDCERIHLEKEIIKYLSEFKDSVSKRSIVF